jgi:hypothetical protein
MNNNIIVVIFGVLAVTCVAMECLKGTNRNLPEITSNVTFAVTSCIFYS